MASPAAPTPADPLVTADELVAYPGAPFTRHAVEIACAEVRGECHWHIAPAAVVQIHVDLAYATDVLVLDSLALSRVLGIVDNRTGPITGYRVSNRGMVQLPRRAAAGIDALTLTVEHGLTEVPADLKAVIADRARTIGATATRDPDLRTRTVGSVSYTWVNRSDGSGDPYKSMRHVLRRFTV